MERGDSKSLHNPERHQNIVNHFFFGPLWTFLDLFFFIKILPEYFELCCRRTDTRQLRPNRQRNHVHSISQSGQKRPTFNDWSPQDDHAAALLSTDFLTCANAAMCPFSFQLLCPSGGRSAPHTPSIIELLCWISNNKVIIKNKLNVE